MISITPESSLVHQTVQIVVESLEPYKTYRIELRLLHKTGTYRSFGVFKSNVAGNIKLHRDAPIRGSYVGVNERGLFESTEATDNVRFGGYCSCTPPVDLEYQLLVFDSLGGKVGEALFVRKWMHPNVERIEVEEVYPKEEPSALSKPKVTGTIFKPPGSGPFPTIIDISGSGGGLNEQKGAALASRGFAVLCLAFFQYKSLPKDILAVDLQYFEDAVGYVTSLPYVKSPIGFQGVSYGGTLAMYLSTNIPSIKAFCSINGSWILDEFAYLKVHGERPAVARFPQDRSHLRWINDMMVYRDVARHFEPEDGAEMKMEATNPDAAFRFVTSCDDLSVPTIFTTNYFANKLRELGRSVDVHFLPGGHLMDPPCFPAHPVAFSKIAEQFQAYGGEASLHGKSQFDAWEGTVQFFSKHLGAPTPLPDYLRHSAKL